MFLISLSLPYPHACMCIYACVCLCLCVCSLRSGWRYVHPEMIGSWHLLYLNYLDLNMAVYSSELAGSLNLVHIITEVMQYSVLGMLSFLEESHQHMYVFRLGSQAGEMGESPSLQKT